MAANLTPQYLEAEAAYKKAQTAEERLECLKKMYALVPKHKASEKLQADLKTKISEAKDAVETERKNPKKVGISYKIPRQGAGQCVLVGGPNCGKSQLLARLTRAAPEVAPFPFTTREPMPGMMNWEDVHVQLIDLPPITSDFMEGYVSSIVRTADAALLVVDLGDDDSPFAAEAALERLAQNKTVLAGQIPSEYPDLTVQHVKTMLIANKADLPGADDRLAIVREFFAGRFSIHVVSAEKGTGLDTLRADICRFLDFIRVYTKQPGKPPDLTSPFTCHTGSTLVEMASLVHRDFADGLKSARLWRAGVYDGMSVKRDEILHDKDVVELHL
jgi:uncharacterized protein